MCRPKLAEKDCHSTKPSRYQLIFAGTQLIFVDTLLILAGTRHTWQASCTLRAPMWKHWVARSLYPYEPFSEFESASWFWKILMKTFPETVSAVLMPNHLHLILPSGSESPEVSTSKKIAGILAAMSVQCGLKRPWQPIPSPAEIPDIHHLRRHIRYNALNPCRKNLCQDPLEWYWSTYRELMGGAVDSSQNMEKLAKLLKESPKNFGVRFHAYVSADPSVGVTGTPFPKPDSPKLFSEKSITEIIAAASGALRANPSEIRKKSKLRHLFVHLAYRHGWRRPIYLAGICGVTPGAIRQILQKPTPPGIQAADLCLGDARLRYRDGVSLDYLIPTENAHPTTWSRRFL